MPSSKKNKSNDKAKKMQDSPSESEKPQDTRSDEATILDDPYDPAEVQDIKQLGLFFLNEFADFHERVRKWASFVI